VKARLERRFVLMQRWAVIERRPRGGVACGAHVCQCDR
jgi:hypothetical protein